MSIPDSIRAAAPRPVLIIAAGAVPGEPVAARWFQAASPATVQLWVVPHAGHTQGLATAPLAWEARVISFLTAALHPVTPPAGQKRWAHRLTRGAGRDDWPVNAGEADAPRRHWRFILAGHAAEGAVRDQAR
jgi:hypothetical protein